MKTRNPPIAISALALLMAAIFFGIPRTHAKGVDPEEKVGYYLYDHLGGVDAILDEQGNVMDRRDYLPFGEERVAETIGADKERHGFTGKELDSESGLYYYGARYYDPALGRFASLDPLVLGESAKPLASVLQNPQALNGYGYALNNPVRYVDDRGEYGKPFHYDFTDWACQTAKMPKKVAEAVAFFDNAVDTDPRTAPRGDNPTGNFYDFFITVRNLANGATVQNHFNTPEYGINKVRNAISDGSIQGFGDALHPLQDPGAHGIAGYGGQNIILHTIMTKLQDFGIAEMDPDLTENSPRKAFGVGMDTLYYAREFEKGREGVRWGIDSLKYDLETAFTMVKSAGDIAQFVSASDKSKTNIEKQISK